MLTVVNKSCLGKHGTLDGATDQCLDVGAYFVVELTAVKLTAFR